MIRITKKPVNPSVGAAEAFAQQRAQEFDSVRLRNAVKALLNGGKAHTSTVGKVFALILSDSADRISAADVRDVLPGFQAEQV